MPQHSRTSKRRVDEVAVACMEGNKGDLQSDNLKRMSLLCSQQMAKSRNLALFPLYLPFPLSTLFPQPTVVSCSIELHRKTIYASVACLISRTDGNLATGSKWKSETAHCKNCIHDMSWWRCIKLAASITTMLRNVNLWVTVLDPVHLFRYIVSKESRENAHWSRHPALDWEKNRGFFNRYVPGEMPGHMDHRGSLFAHSTLSSLKEEPDLTRNRTRDVAPWHHVWREVEGLVRTKSVQK